MLPINKKISSYNHYKYNNPKYLIYHYVGAVSSAKNNVDYFYGGDRNASCHYFVDDIEIWQSVEDFHGAWHIGNSKTEPKNGNSLGIEMCLQADFQVSEKTEQNALELGKYLMDKYNIPIENVRTHAEVTNYGKICPNWNGNDWERWRNFKAKLVGQEVPNIPTPPPSITDEVYEKAKRYNTPKCKELQAKLKQCGYGIKWVEGIYGKNTHSCLGQFQKDFGLTVDYLAGNNTFTKLNNRILQLNPPNPSYNVKENVKKVQRLCNEVLGSGLQVDGKYGTKTDAQVRKLPLSGVPYTNRACTRYVQECLGIKVDGVFFTTTEKKLKDWQRNKGLLVDGIAGYASYKSLAVN